MSYLDNTGVSYLWSKIKAAFAAKSHTHSASDVTSGTLPISRGGTGATTAAAARTALEVSPIDGLYYAIEETATSAHQYTPQALVYIKSLEKLYRTKKTISIGSDIPSQSDIVTLSTEIDSNTINISRVSPSVSWSNYSVGEYVRVADTLRRITSAISTGDTIDNSNSVVVRVVDELADAKAAAKDASNITSGTLSADRIPTLPASKISGGTISGGGLTISGGNLTTSDNKIVLQSTNINRDGANPSSQTEGNAILSFGDTDSERICQLVPRRNTDGSITLSIASVNEKTDGTQVYCAIAVTVGRDGSQSYSVSDPVAFRSAIGAAKNTWTQVASVYGSGAMSYDLTGYSEVMFAAYNGNIYMGTCVVPINLLSSTEREIYLGGGYIGSGSSGRIFAIKATSTRAQQATATVDGNAITCLWVVYAR